LTVSASDLVWFVFSSGGAVALTLGTALWVWIRPRSTLARRVLLTVAVLYALASVYGVSYPVGRLLVLGFRPLERADVPAGSSAVVLLGSGTFTALDWDDHRLSVLDPAAASRVLEAVRVFRIVDPAWVISSGGLVDPDERVEPSGITMRDALVTLGVPASRILVESRSRTTHEEAVIVAPMIEPLNVDHVILVTSDTHMRRSLGAFRAQGVDAIPAIARHPYVDAPWLIPSEAGLAESALVAHEIVGIGYYLVRGWFRP
jgi:uncharacterized SAM-binding protein YcdF (DUF218 family)